MTVKLSETARLLGKAALIDNRTVGEADTAAWHEIVGHLPFEDCLEALRLHRAAGPEWLMPSHILHRVNEIRAARLRNAGTPPIPSGLTHQQETAWRQLWCRNVKDGLDLSAAEAEASAAMGIPVEIAPAPDEARVRAIESFAKRQKSA